MTDRAAVQLGRKGGLATAAALTEEQRREAASHAAKARWAEYYKTHPKKARKLKRVTRREA